MKRKIWAGGLVALLAAVGLVGGGATAASAHTGDMSITAVCNQATGQYDLTAKLTITQTERTGVTKWRVGDGSFQGTPTNANGMDRGPVNSTGPSTITLGTWSLPGTTTGKGPWVYAHTTWSDGFSKGSDGQLYDNLKGDCKVPVIATAAASIVTTPGTCEAAGTASWSNNAFVTVSDLPQTAGAHEGTATAQAGYSFPDGTTVKTFPYTLENQLDPNAPPCYTPPVEVPPAHNANGEATCGAYSITLYNVQNEGEINGTASYVVYIDGKFDAAYAVAGNETETITGTFPEDSGNHQVIVRTGPAQGDEFVFSLDVTSDCIPPKPADDVVVGEWSKPVITCDNEAGDEIEVTREVTTTPYFLSENGWVPGESTTKTETDIYVVTEEDIEALDCAVVIPPTEEPKPPVVTPKPPVKPVAAKVTSEDTLATTGIDPLVLALGLPMGVAALALGGLLIAKRRKDLNEVTNTQD